jgi:hypothetical protein
MCGKEMDRAFIAAGTSHAEGFRTPAKITTSAHGLWPAAALSAFRENYPSNAATK